MQVLWSFSSPKFHNRFSIINILLLFTLFPLMQSPKGMFPTLSSSMFYVPKKSNSPLFPNVVACLYCSHSVSLRMYYDAKAKNFCQLSTIQRKHIVSFKSHLIPHQRLLVQSQEIPTLPSRIPAQPLLGADWLCILNVLPPPLHHSIRFLWGGTTSLSYL